jgi:hypothetical protein
MKRGTVVSILLVLLIAAGAVADEATTNWQGVILESFDPSDPNSREWIVQGSRFLDTDNVRVPFGYQIIEDQWPEAMGQPAADTPGIMGVQASFKRRGYNWLEFIPVSGDTDENGNPIPDPIPIEGSPMSIDLWAWSPNNDFYVEVHIADYNGIVHQIRLGGTNYLGWRNLQATIPGSIPRSVRNSPFARPMELVKVVLWTRPSATVGGFQFYLDQIKVLTDMFVTRYDGEGLANPDFISETWGTQTQ